MNRPIRIGLIAEGEAELGASIPYIKPEDGGRIIQRENEGALHTLIRRELKSLGLPDCDFVQRHPLITESRCFKRRTGHSILDPKYLAQVVIAWKPEEVDVIVIVVDADDNLSERQKVLELALTKIRSNHLDGNDKPISDGSAVGLAIKNFETWLLADIQTISKILSIEPEQFDDLENLSDTKDILERMLAKSTYLSEDTSNQRPLRIRWNLAFEVDLEVIKTRCITGYAKFAQDIKVAVEATTKRLSSSLY